MSRQPWEPCRPSRAFSLRDLGSGASRDSQPAMGEARLKLGGQGCFLLPMGLFLGKLWQMLRSVPKFKNRQQGGSIFLTGL